MTNKIIFQHNFCESRMQDDNPPELFNAFSAFAITIVPLVLGIPSRLNFKNVSYMLILNGGFSCYYHYSLTWLGKHLDEITMILATYFINVELSRNYTHFNLIHIQNTFTLPVILAVNTIPTMDIYFPYIFAGYCAETVIMMVHLSQLFGISKGVTKNLGVAALGTISWLISEHYCNEITQYGHILWHILFPLGVYNIILIFDKHHIPEIYEREISV